MKVNSGNSAIHLRVDTGKNIQKDSNMVQAQTVTKDAKDIFTDESKMKNQRNAFIKQQILEYPTGS